MHQYQYPMLYNSNNALFISLLLLSLSTTTHIITHKYITIPHSFSSKLSSLDLSTSQNKKMQQDTRKEVVESSRRFSYSPSKVKDANDRRKREMKALSVLAKRLPVLLGYVELSRDEKKKRLRRRDTGKIKSRKRIRRR